MNPRGVVPIWLLVVAGMLAVGAVILTVYVIVTEAVKLVKRLRKGSE